MVYQSITALTMLLRVNRVFKMQSRNYEVYLNQRLRYVYQHIPYLP